MKSIYNVFQSMFVGKKQNSTSSSNYQNEIFHEVKSKENAKKTEPANKIMKEEKKNPTIWLAKAGAFESEGNFEKMHSTCMEAYQLFPDNPEVLIMLGNANIRLKRYQEAIPILKSVQNNFKDKHQQAEGLKLLGICLLRTGDAPGAIKLLEESITIDKAQALLEAEDYLGQAYAQIEDYSKAVEYFEKYVEKYPFPIVYYNLGVMYFKLTNDKKAIENFKIAAQKGYVAAEQILLDVFNIGETVRFSYERNELVDGSPAVYRHYTAPDLKTALSFLEEQEITEDLYFVVLETPEGTVAKDRMGVYYP